MLNKYRNGKKNWYLYFISILLSFSKMKNKNILLKILQLNILFLIILPSSILGDPRTKKLWNVRNIIPFIKIFYKMHLAR